MFPHTGQYPSVPFSNFPTTHLSQLQSVSYIVTATHHSFSPTEQTIVCCWIAFLDRCPFLLLPFTILPSIISSLIFPLFISEYLSTTYCSLYLLRKKFRNYRGFLIGIAFQKYFPPRYQPPICPPPWSFSYRKSYTEQVFITFHTRLLSPSHVFFIWNPYPSVLYPYLPTTLFELLSFANLNFLPTQPFTKLPTSGVSLTNFFSIEELLFRTSFHQHSNLTFVPYLRHFLIGTPMHHYSSPTYQQHFYEPTSFSYVKYYGELPLIR